MTRIGPQSEADFDALRAYLEAEMRRADAETQAIRMASEHSFRAWAHAVLERVATDLGLSIGYLVGFLGGLYTAAKESLAGPKAAFLDAYEQGKQRGRR